MEEIGTPGIGRTGNEGGTINEDDDKENLRRSKDKIINCEGRRLINEIEGRGWTILNGSKGENGEWTYVGENGASVFDYIICNQEAMEEIERLKVGSRTDSDHMPIETTLYGIRDESKEKKMRRK